MSSQLSPSNLTGRRRSPSSAVVALPSHRTGELNEEFLARVDARMSEVVNDLEQVWSDELAPAGSSVDVLTEHDLPDLLRGLIRTGGKRIRPSMCLWGWVAAGGRRDDRGAAEVLQVATALELLHVFALIHDDVMDESASRRGQPSVHTLAAQLHLHSGSRGSATRFGDNIAVLVGDLAHAEADHLVSALPAAMRAIWRVLVIELVRGQSRDLTGSAAGRRDLAHARQVALMKSGCYTVWRPLQLGAAAAGAEPATVEVLASYGSEVGEAFALRDDLLGVWGDPARTGKPAGDDLLSGKPTVIISLAYELLHGPAREVLERVGTPALSPADVTFLQDALRAGGVVDAVESRISAHVHAAVAALDTGGLDPQGVAGLTQMAHRIAWRDR